jgi:hypothetical protein
MAPSKRLEKIGRYQIYAQDCGAIRWPNRRGLLLCMVMGLGAIGSKSWADALSTPSMTAPLSANASPASFDGGPLGKVFVTGQLSGLGLVQSNHAPSPFPGNSPSLLDLSNAQVEVQTTSGPVQFYVQAGAYSLPALGAPYLHVGKAVSENYGAVPVAYAKFVLSPEWSVEAGALPTLIGAEYTFTFQNMNIERGLLWNQEPAVSKGVQVNYSKGPLSASVSINDGYDSDHYNWASGLLTYTINPANTVAFAAGGNFSHTYDTKFVAPVAQGNGSIYNLIYTYTQGPLTINPYFQYSHVDSRPDIGLYKSASSYSGAVLAKYTINPVFSLAGRAEYVSTSSPGCGAGDGVACSPTNLMYGPGSDAWSITVTPTYQKGIFFARGEVSYVGVDHMTPGDGFGLKADAKSQVRGLIETGLLF